MSRNIDDHPTVVKETRRDFTLACSLIAAERNRQVGKEGWSPMHDDDHNRGELAQAGSAYALNDEDVWPWEADGSWNPGADDVRRLVKAGALIAAEIDRLLRVEAQRGTHDDGAPVVPASGSVPGCSGVSAGNE